MTPRANPTPGELEVEWGLLPSAMDLSEALWSTLEREIAPYRPKALVARVSEDEPQVAWYAAHGFEVEDRMWVSTLLISTGPARWCSGATMP
jgi:hypothetical protein